MLIWFAVYSQGISLPLAGLTPVTWHAHEMIYGYSLAVVAGFLLTAVGNWTGRPMLSGWPLLLLFLCWLLARLSLLAGGSTYLLVAAIFDLLFLAGLILAITVPIVRARLWPNLTIVVKLILLLTGNLVFFLGAAGRLEHGVYWGLYSGLYLVLALIFMLSRRVLPFFIENGVGYPVKLRNSKWVDIISLVLFTGFWIAELVQPNGLTVAVLAVSLFILHLWRWLGWYTAGIWKKPLLWSLYLAYAAIIAGFALKAAVYVVGISPYPGLHAFAVGGVGMMTLGMMARIALGHTGRSVFEPPPGLGWMFMVLGAAALVRVVLPLLDAAHY
ncbi:MAG TPA: NnrS family protein, partial [Gammaproteobacteria bacterium]|nr:NnrS family protein [Gammaproteobacteria bacterium]